MSKAYTNYLKGIAILMMVALHLFKPSNDIWSLGHFFYIGEMPLIAYLTRMCDPVPFFLILSGYGLYSVYSKEGGVRPYKRVLSLYIHLWIIYAIFVPLAIYLLPNSYPGSLWVFIKNATSWQCSYAGEQWFFFPYILLMALSKWIFKVFDKLPQIGVLLLSIGIYMATIVIMKRYGEDTLDNNMLFFNIFLSFYMLLPFSFGYLAKRYCWMERVSGWFEKYHIKNNWVVLGALLLICVLRCFISHQTVDPIYAIAFVVLFSMVFVDKGPGNVLTFLGKHSMNIWLIHNWISLRLFHEFVYGLHYPVVIYLFVLLASIAVSMVVELVYVYLDKWLGLSKKRV